ncbi:MAG: HyaD/HybD family hydrogenase maturation endopeptidase [Magnetovibrionaceae bacterium]
MTEKPKILVLGIGNIFWADEGFGVRCVERMHSLYSFPENVEIMDGGTQGLYLVQHVQACDYLLVFDAVDYGLTPGAIQVVHDEEVPKFTGAKKMSLHQTGFQEVLSAADLLGDYPTKLCLIGVQAVELENWGGSLTDKAKSQIDPALDIALKQLAEWGASATERPEPLGAAEGLLGNDLDLGTYEQGAIANGVHAAAGLSAG